MLKVLTFSTYFLPGYKGGGPIKTIKNLFDQAGEEVEFRLITSDHDLGESEPYDSINPQEWNAVGRAQVFYTVKGLRGLKQIYSAMRAGEWDAVYLNSFFSIKYSFLPLLVAKWLDLPVILGPRGSFSKGALSLKFLKKKIFIELYQLFRLHRGVTFQASTEFEKHDIVTVLGDVDVYVAEDIGTQEFASMPLPSRRTGVINAVFLSRISPIKNLLTALRILRSVELPVVYDIYGPVEDVDYWEKCKCVIEGLPAHVSVRYKGLLTPDEVVVTLARYDVFFFPTCGENYGHVIAEALCAGLPLLIADTTPWRGLEALGIGWDLSLTNERIFAEKLDELNRSSVTQLEHMRRSALVWAENKFTQRDAIEANVEMFRYAFQKSRG